MHRAASTTESRALAAVTLHRVVGLWRDMHDIADFALSECLQYSGDKFNHIFQSVARRLQDNHKQRPVLQRLLIFEIGVDRDKRVEILLNGIEQLAIGETGKPLCWNSRNLMPNQMPSQTTRQAFVKNHPHDSGCVDGTLLDEPLGGLKNLMDLFK
jgi:hypothetical protein